VLSTGWHVVVLQKWSIPVASCGKEELYNSSWGKQVYIFIIMRGKNINSTTSALMKLRLKTKYEKTII